MTTSQLTLKGGMVIIYLKLQLKMESCPIEAGRPRTDRHHGCSRNTDIKM